VVGSWRMEAEEAGGLQAFLEQEGIHSLVDYIRRKVIALEGRVTESGSER